MDKCKTSKRKLADSSKKEVKKEVEEFEEIDIDQLTLVATFEGAYEMLAFGLRSKGLDDEKCLEKLHGFMAEEFEDFLEECVFEEEGDDAKKKTNLQSLNPLKLQDVEYCKSTCTGNKPCTIPCSVCQGS